MNSEFLNPEAKTLTMPASSASFLKGLISFFHGRVLGPPNPPRLCWFGPDPAPVQAWELAFGAPRGLSKDSDAYYDASESFENDDAGAADDDANDDRTPMTKMILMLALIVQNMVVI